MLDSLDLKQCMRCEILLLQNVWRTFRTSVGTLHGFLVIYAKVNENNYATGDNVRERSPKRYLSANHRSS